ncbi:unnamed protein product [Phyllotreta striolata]|uniref:Major facilitator superfamily (MFS) profile domain-containing protein n=1 Tax=Phyllotreta striolata TaxID=444603 RepID=A0A9N9XRJ4_PHYSR|nr:unnamed protein product [Phyllotreta striolata]
MAMEKIENNEKAQSSFRESLPQILAVSIKNVLLLIHGMSLGFTTILIPGVSGNDINEPILLGQEEISWIGSINLIFVPLGCVFSGTLTQIVGRKKAMQFVNIPFLTAWLLFYFSTASWHIFLAASLLGWSGGLLEAPVLTYVAEITQPHLRGILSSTSTMSVTLGMLSQFILGAALDWRTVTLVNCVLPLISFCLLMLIPETPVWLLTKNRHEEAKKSIAWLRGWTSVENILEEYQELYAQIKVREEVDNSFRGILKNKVKNIKLFGQKNFLWPCLLVSFAFFLGHFNGYSPFQVYAIKIFQALHAPLNEYYSTIIVGVVQLLGTSISVGLIHVFGKRILNFISLFGSGVCVLIVATYSYVYNITDFEDTSNSITNATLTGPLDSEPHTWIPVVFLTLFGFLSYVGIKILPWVLIGEIFAVEIRATASGVSAAIGYLFGFTANKTFLHMVSSFTLPVVFWVYGAVGVIGTVVLYFVLPETEGKSLYEISEHFAGRGKLKNSVRKGNKQQYGCSNSAFEHDEKDDKFESRL